MIENLLLGYLLIVAIFLFTVMHFIHHFNQAQFLRDKNKLPTMRRRNTAIANQ